MLINNIFSYYTNTGSRKLKFLQYLVGEYGGVAKKFMKPSKLPKTHQNSPKPRQRFAAAPLTHSIPLIALSSVPLSHLPGLCLPSAAHLRATEATAFSFAGVQACRLLSFQTAQNSPNLAKTMPTLCGKTTPQHFAFRVFKRDV